MKRGEQKLQTAIVVAYRRRFDAIVFHVPNGGARTRLEALAFRDAGLTAGIPDLVALDEGARALLIECKDKIQARERAVPPAERIATLDPAQKIVVGALRERGFTVVVVDSVEDAVAAGEAFGLTAKRAAPERSEAAMATGF